MDPVLREREIVCRSCGVSYTPADAPDLADPMVLGGTFYVEVICPNCEHGTVIEHVVSPDGTLRRTG